MQELEYLRSEMNQRLTFLYEYHNKIIGNVLLLWGGSLAIFTAIIKFGVDGSEKIAIFHILMIITIFFISVMVMYFASQKINENLNQIFRIAAFIAVFHEKRPDNTKNITNFWELATFDMMIKEIKNPTGRRNYIMDYEHVFLPFFAVFIMISIFIIFIFKIHDVKYFTDTLNCLMAVACVVCTVISLIFSLKIKDYVGLNPQKWFDIKKNHLKSFIEYAKETGYYTECDIMTRFGNNFLNNIGYAFNCHKYCETFQKEGL